MTALSRRKTPIMVGLAVMLIVMISPAHAIFPKLTTNLTGVPINGVTPSGKASINQSQYPKVPVFLNVSVTKVNVPDGTVLAVNLTNCPYFGPVAYLKIVNKIASLGTYLPSVCQIGRASSITITSGTTVILSGGSPWTI